MPTDYPDQAARVPEQQYGVGMTLAKEERPTKMRLVELTLLAKETADNLQAKGLKQHEHCLFGDIVRRMIELN